MSLQMQVRMSTVIERHVVFPWCEFTHTQTRFLSLSRARAQQWFFCSSAYWWKGIQNRGVSKSNTVEEDNSIILACINIFKVWGSATLKHHYINYWYTSHYAMNFVIVRYSYEHCTSSELSAIIDVYRSQYQMFVLQNFIFICVTIILSRITT
jgi:hypothetical protein